MRGQRPRLNAIRPKSLDAFVDLAGLGRACIIFGSRSIRRRTISASPPWIPRSPGHHLVRPDCPGTDGVRGKLSNFLSITKRRWPASAPTLVRSSAPQARYGGDWRKPPRFSSAATRANRAMDHARAGAGVRSEGAELTSAVYSHPAVATSRALGFDAGIVISASHNPFRRQRHQGVLRPRREVHESTEREVEEVIADTSWQVGGSGRARRETDVVDAYIAHAPLAFPDRSGSAFQDRHRHRERRYHDRGAAAVRDLGYDVEVIGASPDGRNINFDCGSTHPQLLAETVRQKGCRLGIAFDGDGTARSSWTPTARSSTAMPCC